MDVDVDEGENGVAVTVYVDEGQQKLAGMASGGDGLAVDVRTRRN